MSDLEIVKCLLKGHFIGFVIIGWGLYLVTEKVNFGWGADVHPRLGACFVVLGVLALFTYLRSVIFWQ
jgi:hypothetical protein